MIVQAFGGRQEWDILCKTAGFLFDIGAARDKMEQSSSSMDVISAAAASLVSLLWTLVGSRR